MADPLSQIIELLRPRAVFSKGISGAGRWGVRYSEFGQPGFCAVLEGECHLAVDGEKPVLLREGDLVLLPATPAFSMYGPEPVMLRPVDPTITPAPSGEVRHGRQDGPADVRLLGGYFIFDTPDADLLVSLLPRMIHVCGVDRLTLLVRMVSEETAHEGTGSELVLVRLVELLLVEALRAGRGQDDAPGLLRGLGDARVAEALRRIHGDPEHAWTVAELAEEAGMSRTAFFDRFSRTVGKRPMEYLLGWRMAVAKELLGKQSLALDEVARRVGYSSASTFSTAFSRHVGQPPGRYARSVAA
ncbi:MAG: AraC family transcriptional regulator [Hyphomonas sp.]